MSSPYSLCSLTVRVPHYCVHRAVEFLDATISIWGHCGACGDKSGFPDSLMMDPEVPMSVSLIRSSRLPVVVHLPLKIVVERLHTSDALYREGPFVDKFTRHAESSVPPINARSSFSILDTRTSAFEVETQTDRRDEQIRCSVSSLTWLRASDEIVCC